MENWKAIENNPEVLNEYIGNLGFKNKDYTFKELLALEDWAFGMIGQNFLGAILLFPYTDNHRKFKEEQETFLDSKNYKKNDNQIFMEQLVSNACGTVALYHILSNLKKDEFIEKNSIIDKFVEANMGKSAKETGENFKNNLDIKNIHSKYVNKGETEVTDDVYHHFIALLEIEGRLYEFDGHKKYPIDHGEINKNNYMEMYIKVIKEFMSIDPEKITFSISMLSS